MRDFFRSRRRKVGIVTLLLACVFLGAWVRSLHTGDVVTLALDKWTLSVRSESGMIKCVVRRHFGETPNLFWNDRTGWSSSEIVAPDPIPSSVQLGLFIVPIDLFNDKKHELLGLVVTSGSLVLLMGPDEKDDVIQSDSLAFPVSYIVIPLTLLSAYLLLSKPRNSKSGPTPVQGLSQ